MLVRLHSQATTTPKIRAAIQASNEPAWVLAERHGTDYSGITKGDVSFTEGVSIADMSSDASVGLTGILLGDVNDSYTSYLDSSGTVV